MPQNNGLLVDVDIEPVKSSDNENRTNVTNMTLDGGGGGGENEVNSNVASVNKNIFDKNNPVIENICENRISR